MITVLLIEDEQPIRDMIRFALSRESIDMVEAADANAARQVLSACLPDLILLDWMLPDSSGVELIRWLRRHDRFKHIPALMLTARAQESDKITGLESGADDYMTKPLSLRELQARVKALLRRPAAYLESSSQLTAGPIMLDSETHEVTIDQQPVELTKTEYKLLKFFMINEGKVIASGSPFLSKIVPRSGGVWIDVRRWSRLWSAKSAACTICTWKSRYPRPAHASRNPMPRRIIRTR